MSDKVDQIQRLVAALESQIPANCMGKRDPRNQKIKGRRRN